MDDKLMWWGYRHVNGTLSLKRWWGDVRDYTTDCEDNEFVVAVCPPFEADNHSAATVHLMERLPR